MQSVDYLLGSLHQRHPSCAPRHLIVTPSIFSPPFSFSSLGFTISRWKAINAGTARAAPRIPSYPPLTTPPGPAPSCRLARGISQISAGSCTDLRGNAVSTQDLHRSGTRINSLVLKQTCLYRATPIRPVNGGLKWNCFAALDIRCCDLQTSSMSRVK